MKHEKPEGKRRFGVTQWLQMVDQLGHEEIFLIYKAVAGMKGVVVVDATLVGGTAGSNSIKVIVDTTEKFIKTYG